jgi:hypothetical protein
VQSQSSHQLQVTLMNEQIKNMKNRELEDEQNDPGSKEDLDLSADVPIVHQRFLKSEFKEVSN